MADRPGTSWQYDVHEPQPYTTGWFQHIQATAFCPRIFHPMPPCGAQPMPQPTAGPVRMHQLPVRPAPPAPSNVWPHGSYTCPPRYPQPSSMPATDWMRRNTPMAGSSSNTEGMVMSLLETPDPPHADANCSPTANQQPRG